MDEVVERSGKGYWLFFVCVFVLVYMLVRGRMRNSVHANQATCVAFCMRVRFFNIRSSDDEDVYMCVRVTREESSAYWGSKFCQEIIPNTNEFVFHVTRINIP